MKFEVEITDIGDVLINGKFESQLCYSCESVGDTVSRWLYENDILPSVEELMYSRSRTSCNV